MRNKDFKHWSKSSDQLDHHLVPPPHSIETTNIPAIDVVFLLHNPSNKPLHSPTALHKSSHSAMALAHLNSFRERSRLCSYFFCCNVLQEVVLMKEFKGKTMIMMMKLDNPSGWWTFVHFQTWSYHFILESSSSSGMY